MAKRNRKNSRRKEPMMYIHQPNFQAVSNHNMQQTFVVKNGDHQEIKNYKEGMIAEPEKRGRRTRADRNRINKLEIEANLELDDDVVEETVEVMEEDVVESQEVKEITSQEVPQDRGKETVSKKPFHKMTIEEKVNYLLFKPKYIPTITCEFATEKARVVGKLLSRRGDTLLISPLKQLEQVEFQIDEIISIDSFYYVK